METLYSIKPLEWKDKLHLSFAIKGEFNYQIENHGASFNCSEGGSDFAVASTLEEAKKTCEEDYQKRIKYHLQPALSIGEVANVNHPDNGATNCSPIYKEETRQALRFALDIIDRLSNEYRELAKCDSSYTWEEYHQIMSVLYPGEEVFDEKTTTS